MPARPARHARARAFAFVLAVGVLITGLPAPAAAGTAETMEASILTWMNEDRAARGLKPLYRDARLEDLAGDRAASLAQLGVLTHAAPGDLRSQLDARRIQWYRYAENIGRATYPWGSASATYLYSRWKASSVHWAQMVSDRHNYVGIGFVLAADGRTYGVMVFTEANDRTAPAARVTSATRSGRTVTWTWAAWDRQLQTHTAGLDDMDVQYRVGSGTWSTIRNDTTAKTLTLTDRPRGTTVSIRVRSRDRNGLLSAWTPESRVAIP